MLFKFRGIIFVWIVIAGAGCSGSNSGASGASPQQVALQEVAELIRATTLPNGKKPSKVSDFDKMQAMYPRGYEAVKSGEVVVLWGNGVKGEGDIAKGGGEITAYEKVAPTQGGYVLLSSGEVKQMSADEFKAAPKAK